MVTHVRRFSFRVEEREGRKEKGGKGRGKRDGPSTRCHHFIGWLETETETCENLDQRGGRMQRLQIVVWGKRVERVSGWPESAQGVVSDMSNPEPGLSS